MGGLAERQVRAWQGQSGADSDSVTRDSQSPVSNITLWTTLQHTHTHKSDLKPILPKPITFGVLQSYALINASYSTSTVQKTADVVFIPILIITTTTATIPLITFPIER